MSAFLGPIHFWLYNKIQFQESLIDELVRVATAQGWSDEDLADKYCSKDRRKLDEVIDEANIHGWLQSRIHDAEGRYAAFVLAVAGNDDARLEALKKADCVPLKTIEELRDIAYSIVGEPEPVEFEDRIVGIIEARDGTIMDVVRQVKQTEE